VSGDRAIGPRTFDFGSLSPDQFEDLCFGVVRLEFPDAVRLAGPDHGLDSMLSSDLEGRAPRGWQAKRFTGSVSWPQCRESLRRAIEHHDPRHLTFCFARDLTAPQHRLFVRHLVEPHLERKVDYWGASELTARLNTHLGLVVARRFFGDPVGDVDRIARAVRAGGDIRGAGDVLERQSAIGEFLAGQDPYFFYQTSVREQDAPEAPSAPGTAVRLERIRDGIAARIDVQPRTSDALSTHGPAGRLLFSDDDEGIRARKAFRRFRERGGRLELNEGVSFAMDRVPPGLADVVDKLGEPIPGRIVVEQLGAGVWPVVLRARPAHSDGAEAEVPLRLRPAPEAASDDEVTIQDRFGGLDVSINLRRGDDADRGSLTWRYDVDDSPAVEQRQALRFLVAAHLGAQVDLHAVDDDRPLVSMTSDPAELDPWLAQLLDLFDALVRMERMSGITFDIPEEFDEQTGLTILEVGRMLRDGGASVSWSDFKLVIRPEALSQLVSGGPIRITEEVYVNILDREIHIGRRELEFDRYRIASTEPVGSRDDAGIRVTFVPAEGTSASTWMRLVPADAA
jgi:hypothetical protein